MIKIGLDLSRVKEEYYKSVENHIVVEEESDEGKAELKRSIGAATWKKDSAVEFEHHHIVLQESDNKSIGEFQIKPS